MRQIERTTRFKKDYKRAKRSDPDVDEHLVAVLSLLVEDEVLPAKYRDHPLSGDLKGLRDCHVRPDLVLIYEKVGEDILSLARLGSHSELFD